MLRHVARVAMGLIVAGYAAWVGWPLIAPFTAGGDLASATEAVVARVRGADPLQAVFWIGAALLYLIAAMLTAIGHVRASFAFLFAFLAEVMLRLMASQYGSSGAADLAARTGQQFLRSGMDVDPAPVTLGAVAILGLIVFALEFLPRPTAKPRRVSARPVAQQAAA